MLTGLLTPDAGNATIAGVEVWPDPTAAKARFGFVPDNPVLFGRLTAVEMLQCAGMLRGMDRDVLARRSADLLVYAVLAKPPASARWFKLLRIVLALVSVGYAGYVVITGDRQVPLDFGGFLGLAFWPVFGFLAGRIYFRRKSEEEKAGLGT